MIIDCNWFIFEINFIKKYRSQLQVVIDVRCIKKIVLK